MSELKYTMDENDDGASPISSATNAVVARLQPLFSKKFQRAYLGILLFASTALLMVGVSIVAYFIFYYRFIPQIELQRLVHLQFGGEHPWGTASLGAELATLQPYDVTVKLDLPRTPSNLDAGNFMLDLTLLSRPSSSGKMTKTASTDLIAHSRRPAILTYASPMVDTSKKLAFMPFYLAGWRREAETLEVRMMERIEFPRGWRNLPESFRLEIHSDERMQVYNAQVHFKATLTGLRWFVYNWRLSSFVIFGFMFWSVSMVSTSIVWAFLAYAFSDTDKEPQETAIKPETRDDEPIKEEAEDSAGPSRFPLEDTKASDDSEEEDIKLETATTSEVEDAEGDTQEHVGGYTSHSGMGTALESAEARGVQRRRSHLFQGQDS